MRRISFEVRTYNVSIGRFDGVDPLADAGPSIEDSNVATGTVNSVGQSSSMFPRFFISLANGSMREYFHTGKRSKNTNMNIKTVNLRNIKKYDYFKRNR